MERFYYQMKKLTVKALEKEIDALLLAQLEVMRIIRGDGEWATRGRNGHSVWICEAFNKSLNSRLSKRLDVLDRKMDE